MTIKAIFIMAVFVLPLSVCGQDVQLPTHSDATLETLLQQRETLSTLFLDETPMTFGPDNQILQMLQTNSIHDEAMLRAFTDLLSVYDNLQCDADRAKLKPLLIDRAKMYGRIFSVAVKDQGWDLIVKTAKLQATKEKTIHLAVVEKLVSSTLQKWSDAQ